MNVQPVIIDRFHSRLGEISVDLDLDVNLIMVCNCRDLYKDYLLRMMGTDTRYADIIRIFQYKDRKNLYKSEILSMRGKFIVVDNADALLDDELRQHMAWDIENQYIFFGRDPHGFFYLSPKNMKEVACSDNTLYFKEWL